MATTAGTAQGTITNNGTDIDYVPAAGEEGTTVTFDYEICPPGSISGDPLCDTATVTVDIPNDAVDDGSGGDVGVTTNIDVLANDTLAAGSTIVATTAGTAQGTITNNGTDIDYTPDPSEAGTTVTFDYESLSTRVGFG